MMPVIECREQIMELHKTRCAEFYLLNKSVFFCISFIICMYTRIDIYL